jgi:hypothetical protein
VTNAQTVSGELHLFIEMFLDIVDAALHLAQVVHEKRSPKRALEQRAFVPDGRRSPMVRLHRWVLSAVT